MDQKISEYLLSWDGHIQHVKRAFNRLLQNNELCDVILYAEGQKIGAHKVLLSACSKYFNQLFKDFKNERPVIVLKGIQYDILNYILSFIYNGEVNVEMKQLNQFLEAAAFLKIDGLTDNNIKRKRKGFLIDESDNTSEQMHTSQIVTDVETKRNYLHEKVPRESYEKTSEKPPKMYKIDNNAKKTASYFPDFSKKPEICKYPMDTPTKVGGEWLSDYEFSSQSSIVESQSPENIDNIPVQETADPQTPEPLNVKLTNIKSEYTSQTVDSDIEEMSSFDQNDFANSLDAEIDTSDDDDDDVLEKYLMKTPFASIDEQGLYQCKICNKSYAKKDSLKKHFAVHANNTTCSICGKMLSRRTHLIRHYLKVHGISSK